MTPNDGLDLPPADPTAEAATSAVPAVSAPQAPPDITTQLTKALGPVVQAIQNGAARLDRIEQAQQAAQPQPAPKGGAEADGGFWSQLAAADDPEALLAGIADKQVNKVLTEKLGPGLIRAQHAARDERLEAAAAAVDERYGEGFFDKEIRGKLVTGNRDTPGTLEQFSVWEQADPKIILATIKGALGARLWDQEDDTLGALSTAKKAREARTPANLVGSGMNLNRDPSRLTEDEREALQGMSTKGLSYTEKDYLADRKRGNSIDDWADLAPKRATGTSRAGA